jgi:serine acetyltransferase
LEDHADLIAAHVAHLIFLQRREVVRCFGEDVVVGPGTRITGPAYIGSGVRLGPRTEVTRSI